VIGTYRGRDPSLDDAAAKRRFWAAFRALGEWHAVLIRG
jgi:hypothetical protein